MRKRLGQRIALAILVGILGAFALAGCSSAEPAPEPSAPAPEPAQPEQKAEPAEPEIKMETFEFPYELVVASEDEGSYDVPTRYLDDQGIDYELSDGICTVEAPEGTWNDLNARVFDFMKESVLAYRTDDEEWNGSEFVEMELAPRSCEVGDEFETIVMAVDEVPDDFGNFVGMTEPLVLHAMSQAAFYREFAGLEPTVRVTVADGNGNVFIDQGFDTSDPKACVDELNALYHPQTAL